MKHVTTKPTNITGHYLRPKAMEEKKKHKIPYNDKELVYAIYIIPIGELKLTPAHLRGGKLKVFILFYVAFMCIVNLSSVPLLKSCHRIAGFKTLRTYNFYFERLWILSLYYIKVWSMIKRDYYEVVNILVRF